MQERAERLQITVKNKSDGKGPTRRIFVQLMLKFFGLSVGSIMTACATQTTRHGESGAFVDIDLHGIAPGDSMTVSANDKTIIIRRRSPEQIEKARATSLDALPYPERDQDRTLRPEWLIVFGKCTHGGCPLLYGLGKHGGWLCPCHGSDFDISGRIRSGPARRNLDIPDYEFLSDWTVRIALK